jgi:hypothetical protein
MEKNPINKILYFIFFSVIIFILKPSLIFNADGSLRNFGVGYDSSKNKKTLFNIFTINLIFITLLKVI